MFLVIISLFAFPHLDARLQRQQFSPLLFRIIWSIITLLIEISLFTSPQNQYISTTIHVFTNLVKAQLSSPTSYSLTPQDYNLLYLLLDDRFQEPLRIHNWMKLSPFFDSISIQVKSSFHLRNHFELDQFRLQKALKSILDNILEVKVQLWYHVFKFGGRGISLGCFCKSHRHHGHHVYPFWGVPYFTNQSTGGCTFWLASVGLGASSIVWAASHIDFACAPVDVRVVLCKPGVS